MARLIDNLDLLAKGRMADLKRICGVDDEDLADMVRELRAYDPKPGCQFSEKSMESVTPDVFIRRTRAGYAVELNTATLPRLLVNRRYYPGAQVRPERQDSRAWLSECLASANWLVKALDQRARTIVKVVSEIVKRQQGFFEKGVAAMKPMTLREIAEAIEMHEIDHQPGHVEQICAVRPRPVRAEILSDRASHLPGEGEGAARGGARPPSARSSTMRREILSDDAIAGLLRISEASTARRANRRQVSGIHGTGDLRSSAGVSARSPGGLGRQPRPDRADGRTRGGPTGSCAPRRHRSANPCRR